MNPAKRKFLGILSTFTVALSIFFSMTISLSAVETTTTAPVTQPPTYQTVIPPSWVQTEPVTTGRAWENDEHYENSDLYGNAELVEEEHVIFDSQEITFLSIVTKSGNVFYILVDHRIADKTKNVYFLNKVDEYDLLSLIYAEQTDEDGNPVTVPSPSPGQKSEVTTVDNDSDTDNSEKPKTTVTTKKKKSVLPTTSWIILGIVGVGGVGLMIFYLSKTKKSKPKSNYNPNNDDYDDDDGYFEDDISNNN